MITKTSSWQIGALLCATAALAQVSANAAIFVDDFHGSALDLSRWSILDGTPGINVAGDILALSGGPDHKRIESIATFTPGALGVLATAKINLGGDYQKFGFALSGPGVAFYFDTFDNRFGENTNTIRTQAYSYPTNSYLFDASVPVSWGSFHELSVEWLPTNIRFLIDGAVAAEFVYLTTTENLPVEIWNDRTPLMQTDFVRVSAIPLPSTMWLMLAGIATLLGTKRTKSLLRAQGAHQCAPT